MGKGRKTFPHLFSFNEIERFLMWIAKAKSIIRQRSFSSPALPAKEFEAKFCRLYSPRPIAGDKAGRFRRGANRRKRNRRAGRQGGEGVESDFRDRSHADIAGSGNVTPLPGAHPAVFPKPDGLRFLTRSNRIHELFLEQEHGLLLPIAIS
jgi:hypothetical protein